MPFLPKDWFWDDKSYSISVSNQRKFREMTSLLDHVYARCSNRRLFFNGGWGDLPRLRNLMQDGDRQEGFHPIDVTWYNTFETEKAFFRQGEFPSPYDKLPLPAESKKAFFELVLPKNASETPPI